MALGIESPFPPPVAERFTLTNVVVPATRSRKKTFTRGALVIWSGVSLVVLTRLFAVLPNRMYRPSGLVTAPQESPLPPAGAGCAESRTEPSWRGAVAASMPKQSRQSPMHATKARIFIEHQRVQLF